MEFGYGTSPYPPRFHPHSPRPQLTRQLCQPIRMQTLNLPNTQLAYSDNNVIKRFDTDGNTPCKKPPISSPCISHAFVPQKCRPIWALTDEECALDIAGLMEQYDSVTINEELCTRTAAASGTAKCLGALEAVREEEEGGGGGAGGRGGEDGGRGRGGGGGEGEGGNGGSGVGGGGRGGHGDKAAQQAAVAENLEEQMLAAEDGLVEAMANRALAEIRVRRRGGPAYRRLAADTGPKVEQETMLAAKAVARHELNTLRKEVDLADFARKGREWRSGRMRRIWTAAVEAVDREVLSLLPFLGQRLG